VADQRADANSVLNLCRDLIALRRERRDLREGAYATLEAPEGVWAWRRGDRTSIVVNCSDEPVEIACSPGRIEIDSRRARDGSTIGDRMPLEPWEAVVMTERG
jgi:oligo-1,6-glucosidase